MATRVRCRLCVGDKRFTVPPGWFQTMLRLCHIVTKPRFPTEATLARGRHLIVSHEGTLQIRMLNATIDVPIPISRIYQMGLINADPASFLDWSLAQAGPEMAAE